MKNDIVQNSRALSNVSVDLKPGQKLMVKKLAMESGGITVAEFMRRILAVAIEEEWIFQKKVFLIEERSCLSSPPATQ